MTLLSVRRLDAGYGDFQALFDVSLDVEAGATVALVGANGAGKTTLLGVIAGVLPEWQGTVSFQGRDITRAPDHARLRAGIALVPEGRRLFPSLTVEENLLVGGRHGRPGRWTLDSLYEAFPIVAERRRRSATGLSGGEQQAVAIARALASNPTLLLLDEVSLGLAPAMVERLYAILAEIQATGTTIVLVEQDIDRALAVSDRVVCVLEGRVALTRSSGDLDKHSLVAAYFGARVPEPSP